MDKSVFIIIFSSSLFLLTGGCLIAKIRKITKAYFSNWDLFFGEVGFTFFLSAFVYALMVLGFYSIFYEFDTPEAIDVYRGKTTLKTTYQDSIPVDSVVVFKNK